MPAKLNEYTSENVREEAAKVLMANGFSEDEIQEIHDLPSRQNRKNYGPLNIHKRRLMVNQLVAANFSNEQISEVLQMSKETVNKDRQYARDLYTRNILQTADMHRARLLEEAIDLKNQALEAFQQSKRKVTRTVKEGGDGKGNGGEQIVTIQESAGDVGFLNVAKNLIAEQAKIVGLNNLPAAAKEEKSYHDFRAIYQQLWLRLMLMLMNNGQKSLPLKLNLQKLKTLALKAPSFYLALLTTSSDDGTVVRQ